MLTSAARTLVATCVVTASAVGAHAGAGAHAGPALAWAAAALAVAPLIAMCARSGAWITLTALLLAQALVHGILSLAAPHPPAPGSLASGSLTSGSTGALVDAAHAHGADPSLAAAAPAADYAATAMVLAHIAVAFAGAVAMTLLTRWSRWHVPAPEHRAQAVLATYDTVRALLTCVPLRMPVVQYDGDALRGSHVLAAFLRRGPPALARA